MRFFGVDMVLKAHSGPAVGAPLFNKLNLLMPHDDVRRLLAIAGSALLLPHAGPIRTTELPQKDIVKFLKRTTNLQLQSHHNTKMLKSYYCVHTPAKK
eukprot:GILJ01001882.1.p1 GENE.GILJ01001882.1~~GILJ01001882.1.p1  ORF type:complete len:108 (+),score=11.51 GILJ01001882.1:33-326(+)